MVKGISRRVVVVDAPEHRFFEQAIFIVRNDAAGEGITSRELVEEARRVYDFSLSLFFKTFLTLFFRVFFGYGFICSIFAHKKVFVAFV